MPNVMQLLLQVVNYTLFMALVWYLSFSPPYRQLEPDQAVITVALAHAGERREECKTLTPAEMAKLPPNMRLATKCPRERSPITLELMLDGKSVVKEVADPPGLYADQGVDIYKVVKVPVGEHHLAISMNDNVRVEGPTYTHEQKVNLKPSQLLLIDFDDDNHVFIVK